MTVEREFWDSFQELVDAVRVCIREEQEGGVSYASVLAVGVLLPKVRKKFSVLPEKFEQSVGADLRRELDSIQRCVEKDMLRLRH